MGTNLLLLDSYKNIKGLIDYAFAISNLSGRKLKIVYVFDFDWMKQTFMIGAVGAVDPQLVPIEKNAKKEYEVAEAKIREIAAEYLREHSVKIPFEIQISELNRIGLVQDEVDKDPGLMLLLSNYQTYSEASGGMVGYPNLIEHVDCPAMVIPEKTEVTEIKNVVYASDYHPEDITSLKHLSALLKNSDDLNITILHNEKHLDFGDKLKWAGFREVMSKETGIENLEFCLKSEKDMISAIMEYSNEKDIDLLVILKEKKGFFEDIFSSSETKSVLTQFHKPVLVYQENTSN
jgi:hypothetical protein